MLKQYTDYFHTVIWLILVGLTLITYRLAEASVLGHLSAGVLMAIALIKSQLIANYFIGLHQCRRIWRSLMLSYFLLVGGLILTAYYTA